MGRSRPKPIARPATSSRTLLKSANPAQRPFAPLPTPSTPGTFPPHAAGGGTQRAYGTHSLERELLEVGAPSLVGSKSSLLGGRSTRRRARSSVGAAPWRPNCKLMRPRWCSPACPGRHRRPAPDHDAAELVGQHITCLHSHGGRILVPDKRTPTMILSAGTPAAR